MEGALGGSDPTEHHFTGDKRDRESGLDNFGKSNVGSCMGRFMTPDPGGDHEGKARRFSAGERAVQD
jgi:hypothetical protein